MNMMAVRKIGLGMKLLTGQKEEKRKKEKDKDRKRRNRSFGRGGAD